MESCRSLLRLCALCAVLSAVPGCLTLQDRQPATPQRPTFSSSTATTAEGTVELETGVEYDHHDSSGLPTTFKYGLDANTELYLSGVPWQKSDVSGGKDNRGQGDDLLGVRQRFWQGEESGLSAAWQFAVQIPDGSRTKGFSDDEYHLYAAGILDGSIEQWAWTAFYQYGSLGDPNGGGRQSQHGLAFAASHPIDDVFGAYGELASVQTPARSSNPLLLTAGVTASTDPATVWDLGARFGLNDDGGDTAITAGVTINLGRPTLHMHSQPIANGN